MSEAIARRGRVVTHDVVGWKDIADVLGVSVRTAQRWAERESAKGGPPIYRTPGRKPMARSAELIEWFERSSCRSLA